MVSDDRRTVLFRRWLAGEDDTKGLHPATPLMRRSSPPKNIRVHMP